MSIDDEAKKRPCVYAIRSKATNRIYIGQTVSLDNRLLQHNLGRVKSTKSEGPWEVIAVEFFSDQAKARWNEKQMKRSKGRRLSWMKRNLI